MDDSLSERYYIKQTHGPDHYGRPAGDMAYFYAVDSRAVADELVKLLTLRYGGRRERGFAVVERSAMDPTEARYVEHAVAVMATRWQTGEDINTGETSEYLDGPKGAMIEFCQGWEARIASGSAADVPSSPAVRAERLLDALDEYRDRVGQVPDRRECGRRHTAMAPLIVAVRADAAGLGLRHERLDELANEYLPDFPGECVDAARREAAAVRATLLAAAVPRAATATPAEQWAAVMARLEPHGPALVGLLHAATFAGIEGGTAVVRFPAANATFVKLLERPQKAAAVRGALTSVLGRLVDLRFEVEAAAVPAASVPPADGSTPVATSRPAATSRADVSVATTATLPGPDGTGAAAAGLAGGRQITTCPEAARALLELATREGELPSVRQAARRINATRSLVQKAIDDTPELTPYRNGRSVRASAALDATFAVHRQAREPEPFAPLAAAEEAMLVAESSRAERAAINHPDDKIRRAALAAVRARIAVPRTLAG